MTDRDPEMHYKMCQLNIYYKILMSKDPSYSPSEALDVVYGIFFDEEEEDKELMELVRNPPQSTSHFFPSHQEDQNYAVYHHDRIQEDEIDLNVATDDEKN